jgi:hypothetical protein
MMDFVQILGHPLFAGAAGLAALVAAAFLVDRGRTRASMVAGAAAAVLMGVALVAAKGAAGPPGPANALTSAEQDGCGEAVVKRASLVLHAEPSDSAPAITKLRQGDRVLLACVNADLAGAGVKWTRVRYGMWEGWVAERVEARQGGTGAQVWLERLPPSTLHSAR